MDKLVDGALPGNKYEGELVNGIKHGQGIYTFRSGARYEGEWKHGRRHGWGTMRYASGDCYEGE
jgi:radial spoke head protein 1